MIDEDEKKAAKRAKSEEQRLASIRAKKELEKQRNAIVAQALREVDQKRKRVVFSDSEGEEEEAPSCSQGCSKMPSSASHIKLFDEDSSGDEEPDLIKIANRHEGKKGEKLMKLEARFNSDTRFKLDEKFVSSGSEDEDESEVVQERAKNLEVLSKVLGNTVKPQKRTLKTSEKGSSGHPKARPFTRFDPFNEEHVRWVMKEESGGGETKEEDGSAEASSSEEDENNGKTNGIHYEMQPDFAEELKARMAGEAENDDSKNNENAGSGFSFLAMMGRKPTVTEKTESVNKEVDIVPNKKLKRIFGGGDSDGEDANIKSAAPAALQPNHLSKVATAKFFVTGEEPYLQSLVKNFKRTQALDKLVPRWSNHRDVFAKNYKHLRKEALKKMRQKGHHDKQDGGGKNGKNFPQKRSRKGNDAV